MLLLGRDRSQAIASYTRQVLSLIPISDSNPTRRFPIVTVALIAINVLAFFLLEPGFGSSNAAQAYFVKHAAVPCQLQHTCPAGSIQYGFRGAIANIPGRDTLSFLGAMVSAMFLHAGFLHIAGNMLFLWIFGNNVEDYLGRLKYVVFYLVCGFAASFAQILSSLHGDGSLIPAVGASGAIAGTLGAYLVLFPRARINTIVPIFFFFTVLRLSAFVVLGLWLLFQIFVSQPGVAWQAHVGGFVFGAIAIFLLGGRPQKAATPWQSYDWHRY